MRADALFIVLLSLALVALNALKTVATDDSFYLEFAQHLARHPLDPYGGTTLAHGIEDRPFVVLAPQALPYWLALGIALFGYSELVLKLWLFPIALLLVWAIFRLARRFAPGWQRPATTIAIFSPTIVAGFNFMLDVPALAFGLAAVEIFFTAIDRGTVGRALGAGLLAGIAMQTKYTAVTIPVALLLASVLRGRILYGLAAGLAASAVFVGWELFVFSVRGDSHFLFHAVGRVAATGRLRSAHQFYILFGEIAPALIIVVVAALGASARVALALTAVLIAIYALNVIGLREFTLPGAMGIALWIAVAFAVWRLSRPRGDAAAPDRRDTWFLVGWLVVEIAATYMMSPFPAARRLIGIILVVTLVIFRLVADRAADTRQLGAGVSVAVVFAIIFGVGMQLLDLVFQSNEKAAAEAAAQWKATHTQERRVWFWGAGTFNHYSRQFGLPLAIPGMTVLQPGDILFDPYATIIPPPIAGTDTYETITVMPVGFPLEISSSLAGGHQIFSRAGRVYLRVNRITKETRVRDPR